MCQVQLTPQQIASYRENGFLKIGAISLPEEVERVKVIYDRLFSLPIGRNVGDQFDLAGTDEDGAKARLPQLMNPAKYAPELEDASFRAAALSIAQQLLGDDAEAGDEHAIFKPAGVGAETPWHQDQAYWDPHFEYEALSIWIPLQEATVENGCLQFIPQSHRLGVVEHDSIGGDPRVHGLETHEVNVDQAIACPLPAGGCTVHHCRTLHYAGANRTDQSRRAYILTFQVPPTKRLIPHTYPWLTRRQTTRELRAQ